jgi:Small Multidrug Resistance protein
MAWFILVVSGVLEAVWATALSKSDGFNRLVPSLVFGVALVFSMIGLAIAMRSLPPGTSYAVWVGIGGQGGSDGGSDRLHRRLEVGHITNEPRAVEATVKSPARQGHPRPLQ